MGNVSSVYGPVKSWRVGWSLGIDLIFVNSVCSFNCSYCQLGFIQELTNIRREFIPLDKLKEDFQNSDWKKTDIVTFSGSGEPTLAINLGDAIKWIQDFSGKPVLVLTNGTMLEDMQVRQDLLEAERVYIKLDAADERTFRIVNRPVEKITLSGIVEAAEKFRSEYRKFLGIQLMILPNSRINVEEYAGIIKRISPDEIQVNTPTRPYPDDWYIKSRGSHEGVDYPAKPLKQASGDRVTGIVAELKGLTGIKNITSVFDRRGDSTI